MSIDRWTKDIIMNEKELSDELNNWFNTIDENKPHFWDRNKVGKIIKNRLSEIKRWKNLLSGSRRGRQKAYRKMEWVEACKRGYQGEFEG